MNGRQLWLPLLVGMFLKVLYGVNASLTVMLLGGPFWLQMFAAFLVGWFCFNGDECSGR